MIEKCISALLPKPSKCWNKREDTAKICWLNTKEVKMEHEGGYIGDKLRWYLTRSVTKWRECGWQTCKTLDMSTTQWPMLAHHRWITAFTSYFLLTSTFSKKICFHILSFLSLPAITCHYLPLPVITCHYLPLHAITCHYLPMDSSKVRISVITTKNSICATFLRCGTFVSFFQISTAKPIQPSHHMTRFSMPLTKTLKRMDKVMAGVDLYLFVIDATRHVSCIYSRINLVAWLGIPPIFLLHSMALLLMMLAMNHFLSS